VWRVREDHTLPVGQGVPPKDLLRYNKRMSSNESFREVLTQHRSQLGHTLAELSRAQNVLVLFLRHSGCTFCREALDDLSKQRAKIEGEGTKLAVVHLGVEDATTEKFFAAYGLADLNRFSDPEKHLYQAFELKRGTTGQLVGLSVLWRGMITALFRGHGFWFFNGDAFQMPGAFVIRDSQIVKAYRHATAAARPDYAELACGRG
jgi:peroxiredoxin